MEIRASRLVDHSGSAALGKSTPVDNVPVGFMVLATCPLILWLLDGTVAGFASALLIIGLFAVGLLCLSVGQKNHLAYQAAEVAARPKIPFKLIGSGIVALVVGLLATAKVGIPTLPFLIGCATFILCLVSFGLDPMSDKGLDRPEVRQRLVSQQIFDAFDERFEALLVTLDGLGDDDLSERTRSVTNTVMGLIGTVDFETDTLQRISLPLTKLIEKMEAETEALLEASTQGITPYQRRRYHSTIRALAAAFETRARKIGLAAGRDKFELHAERLFDRMQRRRST